MKGMKYFKKKFEQFEQWCEQHPITLNSLQVLILFTIIAGLVKAFSIFLKSIVEH